MRTKRDIGEAATSAAASLGIQPRPSTEPAFDFAGLLDELDASVRPAFDKAGFEGFDERDDFAITSSFHTETEADASAPKLPWIRTGTI